MSDKREPKYKTGDRVVCVNYGAKVWEKVEGEENAIVWVDLKPELVGVKGTISSCPINQGMPSYFIDWDNLGHMAWFGEDQLEFDNGSIQNHQSNI